MEMLLVVLVGFLLAVVAVPASIIIALSRGKAALQRADLLETRLQQTEEELRAIRAELKAPAPAAYAPEPRTLDSVPAEPSDSSHTDTPPAPEATQTPTMPDLLARIHRQRERNAELRAREIASAITPADPQAASDLPVSAPTAANESSTPSEDRPKPPRPKPSDNRPRIGFEELLAGKVFVWIGAIALVLTGAFLLKYGFDHNIINDRVRVIGAGIFGFALLIAGEFMRRRATVIAQALCGAGVATLFGTVLAGSTLYGLIGPRTAFVMMIVITASAVVLSLRHGPLVALLGMVGGFTLPPLLGQPLDAQPGMIVYLIALEMGVLAVTRKRGWMGISALTLLFSMAWSLGYTIIGDTQGDRALTGLLVLATTVVFVLNTAWTHHRVESKPSRLQPLWLSIGAIAAAAALLGLLVNQGGYAMSDLGMLALMGAGTLVLARIDRRYRPLTWVVAGLCGVVLMSWAVRVQQFVDITDLGVLAGVIAGFGLLFTLGGYACGWAGEPAGRRHFTRLSAVVGPVFLALVTFAGSTALGWREAWWYWTAGVAGLYVLGAAGLLRRDRAEDRWSAQWYISVSAGLVFVAIGQAINHPGPAVGWSLLAASCCVLGWRLRMTALRYIAVACMAVSAVVLLGLPGPYAVDAAGIVILNTFLPIYGIPALACLAAAWVARRAGWLDLNVLARALAVVLTCALALILVRDGFQGEGFNRADLGLYERGTYGIVLLAFAWALHGWALSRGSLFVRQAARVVAAGGLGIAICTTMLLGNPLLDRSIEAGGGLILALSYLYLLPAAAGYGFASMSDRAGGKPIEQFLRVGAIALTACFVGMQVRNGFHFTDLHAGKITLFEWATYGLGWGALGAVLALLGKRYAAKPLLSQAGLVVGLLGVGTALFGTVLIANPLWTDASVGTPIFFNGLWYLYGPTILGMAILAKLLRKHGQPGRAIAVGSAAIAVGFLLVCLLVRQGFSADGVLAIDGRPISAEWYAYSLAWVLLAIGLLVGGILTGLNTLRYGSMAVMLLAVGKVFALDTAQLADLYRVFSFLGLGVTLLVLGYVYQRFVFGRPGLIPPRRETIEVPQS